MPIITKYDSRAVLLALCLAASSILPVNAGTLPVLERVLETSTPRSVEDFSLLDQDGEVFRFSQQQATVKFIFFGFSHCPDVCPTTMAKFKSLYDSGEIDVERVAVILISVDGERDTPSVLKEYLTNFSSDFVGLTGEPAAVRAIAKQFRASFFKDGIGVDDDYTVGHSPQAYVVDSNGRLRAEIHSPSIEAMVRLTNALLSESDLAN